MSRVFTIVVILLLMAVVAIVPRIGTEEQGPDLGDGYAYRQDTLARFRLLFEDEAWILADPPRNPQGMLEAIHEETGLTFVLIPAGEFMMGSPEDEEGWTAHEGPVHRVKVSPFLLCRTECTQSAWERGGGTNESFDEGASLPVETVSWEECHAWCEANGWRLPSEAEWEYTCRAGTWTPFSTGRTLRADQANYDRNDPAVGGTGTEGRGGQMVVAGSLPSNPWGLHEMHGNAGEWCEDAWHDDYAGARMDGTAWTTGGTSWRVCRGGNYLMQSCFCRSACREAGREGQRWFCLGFRPAVDLPRLGRAVGR